MIVLKKMECLSIIVIEAYTRLKKARFFKHLVAAVAARVDSLI